MKQHGRNKSIQALTSLALALGLMTLPLSQARAGNGTYSAGVFNFCVSIRFNATPAQIEQIKGRFQAASQVLADATDGQHRFGTVTIVNDSGASQSAEYWIHSGDSGAYATIGKYGVRGEHINMWYDRYFLSTATVLSRENAYSTAHEFAHHAYGIYDEYKGSAGAAECAPTPDTATLSYCFMDNFKIRGGRDMGGTVHTLNEFCVASNHDPDNDTDQDNVHHKSCWEVIAAHPKRPATAPAGLPVDAPPAAHTVTFRNGFPNLRVMLVLDRSGSMADEMRLVFAKSGASQFVDFLRDNDALGIVSFDDTITTDFALTTITTAAQRAAAKAAINALSTGSGTDIGDALITARNQLTAQADRSCNEIILLLTDGDHNTGTAPASVIPSLQQQGITVLTLGVGTSISVGGQALLQNLATQTGGKYFRVASSAALTGVFAQLAAESTGNGLLTRDPESLASGEVKEVPVLIETGTGRGIFVLTLANPADNIGLSLRTPSGAVLTPASVPGNPNLSFRSDANSRVFEVLNPEAGQWTMILTAGAVVSGQVEALVFATHDGVHLTGSFNKETVNFPEPLKLEASPTFGGERVVGATVTGVATRPDGSQLPVVLHDDGLPAHGDGVAGDGTYAALFSSYNLSGTYSFELHAVNVNGVSYIGEEIERQPGDNPHPVPAFTRMTTATAVVQNVPLPADVSIQNASSPDPVITGANRTYALTAHNNGPGAAPDATVAVVLPAEVTFVSASAGCSLAANTVTCSLGSLANGASASVTIVASVNCTVADGATFNALATASATAPDSNPANNAVAVSTSAVNPPPVIVCPADITAEFATKTGAAVTFAPMATDNCPDVMTVCTPASDSIFAIGTTVVTCTATDSGGASADCSFNVTVLGARGVKQNVLDDLTALLAATTDRHDRDRLDDAIEHLAKSLDPELWIDQTHVQRKHGEKAFEEEKKAVHKLEELMKDKNSSLPDAVLQGFIDRIVKSDRLLAEIAIDEAVAAGVTPKKIDEDRRELAKGDEDAAEGKFDNAIGHYRHAWQHAVHIKIKPPHLAAAGMRLEFTAIEGETYVIQASPNLVDWVTLGTATADAEGVIIFDDPDAARFSSRFYRVMQP